MENLTKNNFNKMIFDLQMFAAYGSEITEAVTGTLVVPATVTTESGNEDVTEVNLIYGITGGKVTASSTNITSISVDDVTSNESGKGGSLEVALSSSTSDVTVAVTGAVSGNSSVNVNLGEGTDTVNIGSSGITDSKVTVNSGEGNDEITLGDLSTSTVKVDASTGDDKVNIGSGGITDSNVTVDGGTGKNEITLGTLTRSEASIVAGEGDDTISVGESGEISGGTVHINAGAGANSIALGNIAIDTEQNTKSNVYIEGGAGSDTITVTSFEGENLTIDGGGGLNYLAVNGVTSGEVSINDSDDENGDTISVGYVNGGNIYVTAGDGANSVAVADVSTEGINVTIGGGKDNDVIEVGAFSGSNLTIDGGAGDNTISVGGGTTESTNISIVGGGAGDTILLEGNISAVKLNIGAGGGTNSISVGNLENASGEVSISGGDSVDVIEVGTFSGTKLTIDGGAGDNTISFGGISNENGEVSISGGSVGDIVSVGGISGGTVYVNAGNGANSISVSEVTSGNLSIGGGENNDTIAVASFTEGKLTIDGGAGDNVVSLGGSGNGGEIFISGSASNTIEIESFGGTALTVGGGSLNNISIAGINIYNEGDVSIEGGTGKDTIQVGDITGNVTINGGAEADSISIGEVTSGAISIDGGDGADFITVAGAGYEFVTITAGTGDNISVGTGSVNFVDFAENSAVTINGIEFKAAAGSTSVSLSFREEAGPIIDFLSNWTGTVTASVNDVTLNGFIPEGSDVTEDYWVTKKDTPNKVFNGTFQQGAWAFVNGAAVREGTIAGDSTATAAQDITVKAYTSQDLHEVYGGAGNDTITIETVSGSGELAVIANGGADEIILTSLDGSAKLTIEGGDGNDTIHLFNEEAYDIPLITGGNLTLSGDTGNDLISLDGAISDGEVLIDAGGNDDDKFDTIFVSSIGGGKVTAYGGASGSASISIGAISGGDVSIVGGTSDDTISIGDDSNYITGGNVSVLGEGGADSIYIGKIETLDVDVEPDVYINGGASSDTIVVAGTSGGKITIDGGTDNDFVSLGGDSNSGEILISETETDSGNDTVIVDNFGGGNLTIDGGAGNDSVSIGSITDGNVSIVGGDSKDEFYIGNTETGLSSGTVNAEGGKGADKISIGKIEGATVTADGGEGEDEISLYAISGGLVSIVGGGKDTISVGVKDDTNSGITSGELVINAGTNTTDTVAVAIETIISGSVTINGGTTGDSITIADISGGDAISVLGNEGNDTISVDHVGSTFTVEGGEGTDTISIGTIEGGENVINGDADKDLISVDYVNQGALTIDGGAGDDTVSVGTIEAGDNIVINGNEGADNLLVSSIGGGSVTIEGGAAKDTISIATIDGSGAAMTIDGVSGSNVISLGTVVNSGEISIVGGSEADTIIVDSIVSSEDVTNNVSIVAGAGDVISVGAGTANIVDFTAGQAVSINGVEFKASDSNSDIASLSFGENEITLSSEWTGTIKASQGITFYGMDGGTEGWTPAKSDDTYFVQSGSLYGGDVWAIVNGRGYSSVQATLAGEESISNDIVVKTVPGEGYSIQGGNQGDTINVPNAISVGSVTINALGGTDTITFGSIDDYEMTVGGITGGTVLVYGGADEDIVSLNGDNGTAITGGNVSLLGEGSGDQILITNISNSQDTDILYVDGGTGDDTISISGGDFSEARGNIFIRGGDSVDGTSGGDDTIAVANFSGNSLTVDAGDGADLVSLGAISSGEVSISGGDGDDTITVNESGQDMLTVVAGAGDVISIGASGNANFVNFAEGEENAVTINGVKFVSDAGSTSASLSFDQEGKLIKFSDSLWSGTITAANGISLQGVTDQDEGYFEPWTPTEGNTTYYVQNGNFFAGAWAVDVTANKYFRGETNIATGSSSVSNNISLRSVNAEEIRMVQGNGSSNDSIEVESVAGGTVTIDALGGNDTINIYGVSSGEVTDTDDNASQVSGNVSLVAGDGNDTVYIGDVASSTVRVDAGTDNDTITIGESGITDGYVTIDGAAGLNEIYVNSGVTNSNVSINGGDDADTISFGGDVTGSTVNITAGDGANSISLGNITNNDDTVSNVSIGAGTGSDTIAVASFTGSNLTIDGGAGENNISVGAVSSGNVSINSGDDADTISVGMDGGISGGNVNITAGNGANSISLGEVSGTESNVSIGAGTGNDTIAVAGFGGSSLNVDASGGTDFVSIGAISAGEVSINGGDDSDTISVDNISDGNVTIDGGAGADVITLNSATENVSIIAGAGDNISVGAGSVDFVNFEAGEAVTINGVEFKSDAASSASLSFDDGITFLDDKWTGTITASEDVTIHGYDEMNDSWAYVSGNKDKSYVVQKGQLFNNVWAKVNSKGIRNGEIAQSSDESLNIEVINELTTGNYSILGSASADTINGANGNAINISGGGMLIDANAGADSITFGDITKANVSIVGGDDADTISFASISESGKVSVEADAGDDYVSIGNVSGGNLTIDGGAGNDSISVTDITTGNVSISGGEGDEGDDTISIGTITDGANVSVVAGEVLSITGGSLTAAIPTSSTINGVTFKSDSEQNETISVEGSTIHLNSWTGTLSAADNLYISDKNGATITGETSRVITDGAFATWATITNGTTATLYAIQGDTVANGTTNADTIKIADGVSSVSIDGNGGADTIIAQTLTGATINTNTEGDYISVTGGNIHVELTADSSTINGAQFNQSGTADITIGTGIITVDNYSGTIVAGDGLKVSDKNGVTVTGEKTYVMKDGEFGTWATVSNGTNNTYVFNGETVVTGTTGDDTITISDAASVSVDGLGGDDTINAHSLSGSTISANGDIISVESGDIYAVIDGASTINGALFGMAGTANVTIDGGVITVDGYSGNITANETKVSDKRGATVTGGNRAYTMTSGVFETWATINDGAAYAFAGDMVANGTSGDDQIVIETMQSVLIDGKGGTDNITADSLHGATIYTATDDISITAGDFLASITGNSTINGAAFGTTGNANVTIDSDGIINVNGYSGSITAAGSSIVKDNRGATVSGDTTYTMTSGVFETWATINDKDYAFAGETFAKGTSDPDKISIASAADVSIDGKAGVDTITAVSLSGATIISEDSDYISVKGGNIFAQISSTATINGALFSGDTSSDAEITIGTGALTVDGYSGTIVAGDNLKVSDKNGVTVSGDKSYIMTEGAFQSWATINNSSYALVGDTVANGTDNADTIQIAAGVSSVLVNGKDGNDVITVEKVGADLTIDGGAGADLITLGTISDGAISVAGNAGNDTINVENINNGNVTIDGGADADSISIGSVGNAQVSVVAGDGDNISVGTGSVNFINFETNKAVTINGVEFKSAAASSASISFDNGGITFLDDNWTGTITASDDMTFTGYNESESWTYTKGSNDKSYRVVSGQLYNDVWAKVNSKGIRNGEIAQSADESLDVEVITTLSSGNYSILGSASADTINSADGAGIIVSGGNVSVNAGAGNDEITFGDISGGNVTIDAGDGIDTVSIGTITDGKVTVVSGENVNVTAGNFYESITTSSTINGVTFGGTSGANINVNNGVITVDTYTGSITASDNITVADKNGATVTGANVYKMTSGAFATWATIGNAKETLYAVVGDTVANGTDEADTIQIADGMASVLINGQGGVDTVIAKSLTDATITSDGDYISVTGGNIYTEINGDSTINGATFTAQSSAEITIGNGALTVNGYTGNITANNLTITDNRGATVTGSEKTYEMSEGVFTTWATVSNGTTDSYAFSVDTVVTGTASPDTITITDKSDVLVDGKAGVDTINANSLTNATLNTDGDIISITSGNIYASITAASTINGALFGTAGNADITFGKGIITVDTYSGSISAGSENLKISDKRGATVSGTRAYTMMNGAFSTWATVSNDSITSYAFAGDTVVTGTDSADTITISDSQEKVLVDGKGGVDTITAATLTGSTINASTDLINVTAGNIYASIATDSTINGAFFNGTADANITIGAGSINVDGYTGSITAGDNLTITDNRGATVSGTRAYTMKNGAFATWATVSNDSITSYAFAGDTVVTGTDSADTITISDAQEKVLVDGKGGVDTITAATLTGSTINAATDLINVTSGNVKLNVSENSTVNGAQFNGTATADVTIGAGSINVDGYTGSITAGTGLTVTDNRGATVSGTRAYTMKNGAFATWATISNDSTTSYAFAGDTVVTGTDSADTITISDAQEKVLVDGKGGVDTITAATLTGSTINAATDYINITAGDIYASITTSSTINGAQFSGTSNTNINIGEGIITVDSYNGNVIAGDVTIRDKNGATVKGHRTYEMTNGAFQSWATINGTTFAIDPEAYGTDNADTIQVSHAQDVLIDGLKGVDTITADSLTGSTINASTDNISVTAGDFYASIATDSTINGALFNGTADADITIGDGIITVDTYTGSITAGTGLTVTDKRGSTITGGVAYTMTDGAFSTWATVNGNSYVLVGDTVAGGTSGNDTITISNAEKVLIDGKGGVDTITAGTLTGSTINAATDNISVTAGNIYASIATDSTINGALFNGTADAKVTIGASSINVDGYTGSITAGDNVTVADKRGATVTGTRAYTMMNGAFSTWATVSNDSITSYAFAGDTVVTGTDSADTITISDAQEKVLIDGKGGVDTITAATLTGSTINASTDLINVTAGNIYAIIATDSTINGAFFNGTADANITIGAGSINVDGYTGSITAGTGLTVTDNRGATVSGTRAYTMTNGAFTTWATINGNDYAFTGDTVANGTENADTINIASADKVLVDGKGGVDTITAATLTGSTINAATDLINVTSGNVKLNVSENSTVNGAQFNGTATADVTIGAGSINVDGYTGSITAGDNFTVTDNRGASVTGNRAYEISGGAFVTWATVNNESYSFAGDTLAVGTDENDTINIASAADVSINGRAGVDTITADSLTGATITADGDFINVTSGDIFFDITNGSTVNGATFAGTSNAEITIGEGVLTVDVFTGNITAGDVNITDNRGATVTGDKVYTMTGGAFTTWATINNNTYAVVGDTSALGTSGDDTITISDAENVLVDALAGVDTISADSLTNATVNAATDYITVTSGTIDLNVNASSTINGAQFNGTGNADVTLDGSTIHLDTWTGYVNFGEDVTLYDKTGAVIEAGNREFRNGILRTIHSWATINGDTYAIEEVDTVAVGTDGNDTINLEPYDNVSVNGLGGIDTIAADSIGAGVTIVANDDFIDIKNGAATFEVVGKSTINGAQFNGTGNAQLSLSQDTITVSDWTGGVVLNDSLTISDKAGSTLTGNVTPILTSGTVSAITGLNNGEEITFGGDTYTMRDDILTVTRTEGTPEIYINATSDTDLLNLTNPYAYIQISDNTLDLNSGAQLLKNGFASVIYGTDSIYSSGYGAALTKDSVDAYNLAQNNLTINEPQIVTSDTKVLTVDFTATLSAASGNYTINGDAYNATTDATISVIPASSSLINGTVSVTDGTIKTADGNSYAISGKDVNLTALEGTVTNLLGTGTVTASMNGDNSFTANDIKYTAGENSNVNINLENDSPALTVTGGNINAELATGQSSNLNGTIYTANSETAKLNATADTVTLTLPLNGNAKVGEITYTGLDEENSAVFSLSGTVTETSNGRFSVDIPQNVSAIIDGTTYTSNQDVNTIEVPATESVKLASSTEKELNINDGVDNSTFDYRKVDVTATVGAATINSVNEDGTGFLEITGSTDAAVSIASAVTSPYKLNGKDLRINGDSDGYGAVANSDGTLTQLNAISSGVSVVSAPSVTLNTDSTGDYTFNNGSVTISGDSNVALVTDDRSNLTGVANLTNGALFTPMESFNLNGNAIGIYGDDGVTLQTDSAGNVVSVGGVADGATINGVGGATVTLPNGGELTINDKPFKLSDDDGVTISGGRVEGLNNGGKLAVGAGGNYVVNGVEITAPENGTTISADNAGTPYIYTGQTASDSLANKIEEITGSEDNVNVDDFDSGAITNIDLDAEGKKSVVIGENVSSDKEVNIDASNTNGAFIQNKSDAAVNVALGKNTTLVSSGSANEVIDASKADNAVVVADNGANITNYDPVEKAVKILLEGLENIVQAIRTDYLSFSNNTIEFGEKKVSLQGTSESGNANAAELYNLYMQPTAVQWSTDEGGDVIADSTKNSRNATQVLIGNKKGNKGSANIKGNNANIIAFIGAGDNIDAGGGDNYIEITTERRVNATGAKILLNEKTGNDVIVGFASGFGETADRISVSNTSGTNSRPKFKFINGRLVMQNSNRRLTFQNRYGSAYDSESDIGNVSKLLIETNTGAEKYAIADSDSTIKVDQLDAPDVYVGNGSTSGVDFSNYESDIEVNLLNSDKFQNIGNVKGATGVHTLIGSTGNDTLTAGDGRASIWGGQGNDVMTGSDTDTKINGTKFYFMEGDGNDTISNFEAYDVTRADRADVFATYNQQVTDVYTSGDDLRVRVGNGDDIVRINNLKNKVLAVDLIGVTEGAQVGDNLNYDTFTKYYCGVGNSTLNVDIANFNDDINIWLDGSDGIFYNNQLNIVDASHSYKKAEIAGNANDNKLIATGGGTSLWGGNGGDDTLAGGEGSDTFFYGYGGGDDVIDSAAGDDIVRAFNIDLSQITNIDVTDTNIKVTFNDGNKLSVNSANSGVQFVLDDGSVYTCDQLTRTWTKK